MCQERTKASYRSQQDGFVHVYGYCLSNIQPQQLGVEVGTLGLARRDRRQPSD